MLQKNNEAAATALASRGIVVTPIRAVRFTPEGIPECDCLEGRACKKIGKHPRLKWSQPGGYSADPAVLARWWALYPNDGIAILTGPSNIVVFDVDAGRDPGQGGHSFFLLCEAHGYLKVDYPLAHTGGDALNGRGFHCYFRRAPEDHYPSDLAALGFPGIHPRSVGHLAIVPPSWHASGIQYVWARSILDGELPQVPEAWRKALLKSASRDHTLTRSQEDLSVPPNGRTALTIREKEAKAPSTIRGKRVSSCTAESNDPLPAVSQVNACFDLEQECRRRFIAHYANKIFRSDFALARELTLGAWNWGFEKEVAIELTKLAAEQAIQDGRWNFRDATLTPEDLVRKMRSLLGSYVKHDNIPRGKYRHALGTGEKPVTWDRAEIVFLMDQHPTRRAVLYAMMKTAKFRDDGRAEQPRDALARYAADCWGIKPDPGNVSRLWDEAEAAGILSDRRPSYPDKSPAGKSFRHATSFKITFPVALTGELVTDEAAVSELGLIPLTKELMIKYGEAKRAADAEWRKSKEGAKGPIRRENLSTDHKALETRLALVLTSIDGFARPTGKFSKNHSLGVLLRAVIRNQSDRLKRHVA